MDWAALFAFDVSPLELVLRGSLVYWFLFLVFRFVMRRDLGAPSTADVLLIVLVADASQNAMTGRSTSVGEGLVLVSTLFAWNWLIDIASYRSAWVARFTEPPALLLVRRGRIIARNLRREHLTRDELMSHLREAGVASLDEVECAYLESDGQFSVIRADREDHRRPQRSSRPL